MNIFKNLSIKNKILIIATITLLVVVVPLTIMQSLNRQTTKQRASNDSLGFSIMLTPSSLTKNIGEDVDVEIHLLNSEQKDVSAVELAYGEYDLNMFESVVFQSSSVGNFTDIFNSRGHYIGVVRPGDKVNYADITLGTLKFIKSKEAGNVNLNFYNIRVNVAGIHDAVSFDNISGQYAIETAKASSGTAGGIVFSTPTPTIIPIQSPTIILTPTLIPTIFPAATPTPTGSFSDVDYNACLVPCNDLEDTTDALSCIQNCKTQYGR